MNKNELLRFLEETLALKAGLLTGHEKLRDLGVWDSMSTLTFIANVDKKYGVPLQGSRVARCQTVDELLRLIDIKKLAA